MAKGKIVLEIELVDGADDAGALDSIQGYLDEAGEELADKILDLGPDLVESVTWETAL